MKKNIAFFSGDITKSGGTEKVATLIANELCKSDEFNISFISLEKRRDNTFFYLDKNITRDNLYEQIDRSLFHILGIVSKLKKYIKKNNIKVLVDIDGILDIYSIPTKLFTKVKVVSWEHFNYFQNPFVPYRKISRRLAAKWADTIVTLTEEDKGYYHQNLKVRCPIECIYNPIIWKKEDVGYASDSKTIISVGRLTYQKGFDILIEIAKDVLPKHRDWKWLILGEGEERNNLEDKIEEYHLQDQLFLKGNVNNIDDYYKQASFFVMTSRFEGLPMTLLETKPYKLPLVSFKCKTGPKELIKHNVNGFLIDEGDNKGMIDAIEELIEDNNQRIKFSESALLDSGRFEINEIIFKWSNLLREL